MAHPGRYAVSQLDSLGDEIARLEETLKPLEEAEYADPMARLTLRTQFAIATALVAISKELRDVREVLSARPR